MSGTTATAHGPTEHELYGSLLAARHRARQRLLMIQEIERQHRDVPLADLAALAVSGALHHLTHHHAEDVSL